MKAIPTDERQRLGALLEHASQEEVMAMIPQFEEAEICNIAAAPAASEGSPLRLLVFNMERGVHIDEIVDFLTACPGVQPFDVILANELDDGCVRSGGKDTTKELARRLGLNYVYGLEFIELVNREDPKGFHGNAIFSRYPLTRARVVRMPEQNNWYFDRQRRIGGRLAILAEVDVNGRRVGMVTVHLENRTDGPGRFAQLHCVLEAAEEFFPAGMPVAIGGDLNTNTFDGRDVSAIRAIVDSPALQQRCLDEVEVWEECLPDARKFGYEILPGGLAPTRRKALPEGGWLSLRLDWLLVRGMTPGAQRVISTRTEDCGFAPEGSALTAFDGEELSDHNAVWAEVQLAPER